MTNTKIHLEFVETENKEILEILGNEANIITLLAMAVDADSRFLETLRLAVRFCEHELDKKRETILDK